MQGRLMATANGNQTQIWAGPLAPKGGLAFAVALVNLNNESSLEVSWSGIHCQGLCPSASLVARDLWERQDLGPHAGSVKLTVEPHDCGLFGSKPPHAQERATTAMTTSMDIPTLTGSCVELAGRQDGLWSRRRRKHGRHRRPCSVSLISNGTNTPEPGKPSALTFPRGVL